MEIRELVIDDSRYRISEKFIGSDTRYTGVDDELHTYRFLTNWMALNEENFKKYKEASHTLERNDMLKKILTGNILSMFKSIGHHEEGKILVIMDARADHSNFKENRMLTFKGEFTTNVLLPPLCGLGKAVSRGFGTIVEKGVPVVSYD